MQCLCYFAWFHDFLNNKTVVHCEDNDLWDFYLCFPLVNLFCLVEMRVKQMLDYPLHCDTWKDGGRYTESVPENDG